MDEIRSERKILKVLRNDNVDSYVNLDMTEVDMLDYKDDKDLSFEVKLACAEKVSFRKRMAVEKVGILRLDYIFRVMRKVYFEKATIANPDSFKSKVRNLEKAEKVAKLKRLNSNSSLGSMSQPSKSQTYN